MEFSEYQKKAMETALPSAQNIEYAMSLIASEAGELNGHWSKIIRDDDGYVSLEKELLMMKEAGDILWGIALLSDVLGWRMDSVAQTNLDKLASRKERGTISGSGDDR